MADPVSRPRLTPTAALGAASPRTERIGSVLISEIADRALVSVAARAASEPTLAKALLAGFGLALPRPPDIARAGALRLFSSAQGRWMLEAPLAGHEDLARAVTAAAGSCASVTEQAGGWLRLDLEGPDLPGLFERLCAVDLRGRSDPIATRCVIEHVGAFVLREDAGGTVTILAPRSMAASLWHAVESAARALA